MTLQGEQVLQCSLLWPELSGKGLGIRAINRYYRALAEAWQHRWKTTLYVQACLDLANRTAEGKPFRPWHANMQTEVTLHTSDRLSLRQESVENWGDNYPVSQCVGETWDIGSGAPLTLSDCLPQCRKKEILTALEEQLAAQMAREDSLFFQESPTILRRQYDPDRFWVESDGVRIFYPTGLLGSRAEGMPVFILPQQV